MIVQYKMEELGTGERVYTADSGDMKTIAPDNVVGSAYIGWCVKKTSEKAPTEFSDFKWNEAYKALSEIQKVKSTLKRPKIIESIRDNVASVDIYDDSVHIIFESKGGKTGNSNVDIIMKDGVVKE